ncbi:NADP-dependent oxidoreductase domain-containing protein [Dactylonectria macrodidyma]|uniref:NADP-dependent oxidoreductase domain-containing protein n=1 Tax=Dactylonectria macrodidyma TaxID=307937 RepID=A0A9P9J3I7_9HYPO|nr:NADP-dependent oxidoreductase domain-containing protein [Dactylonectria macrodidyma]
MTTSNPGHDNASSTSPYVGKVWARCSSIGLGLMGISAFYGNPPSDEERFKVLDRALELGATNWDSSDMYGDNEELVAKWFKRTRKRNKIFLPTKFGFPKGLADLSVIDSSAKHCKEACENSLRGLGIDYIDLYYMHHANPNVPIEETMRAMADLKGEGRIWYIGLSEVSSATLRRAHFVLDIEGAAGTNLLDTCRELGVGIVAYSPLGRGMLTGTMTSKESVASEGDWRRMMPRFSDDSLLVANVKLVNQFKAISDRNGCTPAQLAIAWLLKQGDDIVPIPGTKKIMFLEKNWGSLKVQLTDKEEMEIRSFIESIQVIGSRGKQGFTDTVEE